MMEKKYISSYGSISAMSWQNELGRVHVSLKNQTIVPVETTYIGDAMAKDNFKKSNKKSKNSNKSINADDVHSNIDKKAIDDIWKHLGLGHIDISYACVGYSMDGRPILNHDELVNLLINYGFNVKDVLPFIDDFASHSNSDSKSPIVMFTANTSAIMTNIEPIV